MDDIEASVQNISDAHSALKEAMRQLVRQESTPGPSQPVQPSQPSSPGNPAVTVPGPETEHQTEKGSILIKGVLTGKDQYSVSLNEQQLVQLVKGLEAGNQQLRLVADIAEPYQAVTFQLPVGAWLQTQALQTLDLRVGQTSVRIPMKSLMEMHASTAKTLDVVISKGSDANLSEQQKQ